jgi:cytoskeletal protein RodZ
MHASRRLVPLLACAAIAGVPAVAHAQGGAGDDQYQDPFAGSDSSGGSSSGGQSGTTAKPKPKPAPTQTQSNAPTLTQEPPTTSSTSSSAASSSSSSSSSTSTSSSTTAAPATSSSTAPSAPAARGELPRTGFDAPIVALLGGGLLVAGVGLRMRVAHGRRS